MCLHPDRLDVVFLGSLEISVADQVGGDEHGGGRGRGEVHDSGSRDANDAAETFSFEGNELSTHRLRAERVVCTVGARVLVAGFAGRAVRSGLDMSLDGMKGNWTVT